MPNNTHKSAAVPFVNQKGERSMKRVKVERYVAGKRPAYAKQDEDEEYYTTDDDEDEANSHEEDEKDEEDDDNDDDEEQEGVKDEQPGEELEQRGRSLHYNEDDDDEDDPRFRRLKQIESKTYLINVQPKVVPTSVVIEEDDDEEEIRRRHAAARKRQVEKPIGPKAEPINQLESDLDLDEPQASRRIDTDDLLKDLKLSGIRRVQEDDELQEQKLKESLRKAREDATFKLQVHKKIEEDIRIEKEREALAKGDIGARDMNAVNTDDEDEELAYEEWKLREIKRVLRDRAERANVRA